MFVFSEPAPWEGENAVRQILVFPNRPVMDMFYKLIADPTCPRTPSNFPDENGQGAIYKLRAIKQSNGKWASCIRCGFTGDLISESHRLHDTWLQALCYAHITLRENLEDDLKTQERKLESRISLVSGG